MKHLTLLLTMAMTISGIAQNFPVPYNPDDDANGLIGTPDLLSLLALFGEEFSAAVVSEDSASAVVYMGDMAFPLCAQSCKNLPGMWEMPLLEDLALVWDEVHTEGVVTRTWLRQNSNRTVQDVAQYFDYFHSGSEDFTSENYHYASTRRSPISNNRCYCSIKELPRVEYSYCSGGHAHDADFTSCVNEKLSGGWYPISGFPVDRSRQAATGSTSYQVTGYAPQTHASFWRWAE